MWRKMRIGDFCVGGREVFVTAEIGINHNGDVEIAKKLVDAAAEAGCNAVKFQKRTVDVFSYPRGRHADASRGFNGERFWLCRYYRVSGCGSRG